MKKKLCLIGLYRFFCPQAAEAETRLYRICHRLLRRNGTTTLFCMSIIDNEYWQSCIQGIWDADEELGTTTHVTGPRGSS